MKTVYIMRGPSGSGKSTIIKSYPTAYICSADSFLISKKVGYKFTHLRVAKAHGKCLAKFELGIENSEKTIFVDNTNIKNWHMEKYINIAHENGYRVKVYQIIIKTIDELKTCIERNKHDVPACEVAKQVIEFEEFNDYNEKVYVINLMIDEKKNPHDEF